MRFRTRGVVALAALAAAVAVTACGTTSKAGDPDPGKPAAEARAVTTIDGVKLKIPDGKPAVVFFSVACGSCYEGGVALAQAREKAGARADFLLVDLDPTEPREAIDYFRDRIGDKDLPVVSAGGAELAQAWRVSALSTVIVLDATGEVVYRATDPSAADILAAVDKAATR
jgi:hypothetical protein